jgi:macrodomain Ter protein organizer (MatP/YcbG family)
MKYDEWLEESQINEIPEQYQDAFKQATKSAWEASRHYAQCKSIDLAYVNGLKAGWNFCVDDNEKGYQQSVNCRLNN